MDDDRPCFIIARVHYTIKYNNKITWNNITHHKKKTTLFSNDKITWNKKTPLIKKPKLLITQNDKMTWNKKTHHINLIVVWSLVFCLLGYQIIFFSHLNSLSLSTFCVITFFLGANDPLGPASSEALYDVCLYVWSMYVRNNLGIIKYITQPHNHLPSPISSQSASFPLPSPPLLSYVSYVQTYLEKCTETFD